MLWPPGRGIYDPLRRWSLLLRREKKRPTAALNTMPIPSIPVSHRWRAIRSYIWRKIPFGVFPGDAVGVPVGGPVWEPWSAGRCAVGLGWCVVTPDGEMCEVRLWSPFGSSTSSNFSARDGSIADPHSVMLHPRKLPLSWLDWSDTLRVHFPTGFSSLSQRST